MHTITRLQSLAMTAALAVAGASAGCASGTPAVQMVSSQDIPAARGVINAKATDNGNTQLEVVVRHLARPERVQPGATTYVVWARAPGQQAQNLGALRVDADLKGTLQTVTPLRTFDVFITAESSPTVMAPAGSRLLSANIEPRQ